MKPGVMAEAVEQAQNIGHGEFALAAVHELHGLAILQVNAGNQHGRRTSTPFSFR